MIKKYLKALTLQIKSSIRLFFLKRRRVRYKLDKHDKKFIKMMKEKYDMIPSFNDDGFYTFDLKSQPSFKDAKLGN
jgi:hypothetical protein